MFQQQQQEQQQKHHKRATAPTLSNATTTPTVTCDCSTFGTCVGYNGLTRYPTACGKYAHDGSGYMACVYDADNGWISGSNNDCLMCCTNWWWHLWPIEWWLTVQIRCETIKTVSVVDHINNSSFSFSYINYSC